MKQHSVTVLTDFSGELRVMDGEPEQWNLTPVQVNKVVAFGTLFTVHVVGFKLTREQIQSMTAMIKESHISQDALSA